MVARKLKAYGLLLFGVWMLWGFGWETVMFRLKTEIEGTIISSTDVPPERTGRYCTDYIVRGSDGVDRTYTAGASDASLERSMPVGTIIRKEKWSLDWEMDGQQQAFPLIFYCVVLTIGLGCVVFGLVSLDKFSRAAAPRHVTDVP